MVPVVATTSAGMHLGWMVAATTKVKGFTLLPGGQLHILSRGVPYMPSQACTVDHRDGLGHLLTEWEVSCHLCGHTEWWISSHFPGHSVSPG